MSNFESCYQCIHVYVCRPFSRRKWYASLALVSVASTFLIYQFLFATNLSFTQIKQEDTFSQKIYQDVLKTWYNFTDGVRWYNDKMQSILDPVNWERYMADIRRDWILWIHNPNEPSDLENAEPEDPSMGQASVIRKILQNKKNGFFVECGAYDGVTRSNTFVLERLLNWTGLLIEADPLNFSKMLMKNRKAYLTPTCLAIEPYPSVNSFLMANNVGRLHELNDSDVNLPNSPDVAHSGLHTSVQCFPFHHLMAALNVTTIDYFSLDIEGHELKVLKTIPFDKINIKTLSVEFSHVEDGKRKLIDFMKSNNYFVYSFVVRDDNLAHDIIFVKRSS
ncbi:uncharacterized protein LOC143429061 [Xylocopa sonorina]|uniref:uncharacterized protein LOC143429061 n=1 Tax=Xylocopa sonorina TaxID=1818115 RepID=UPI00403AA888